MNLELLAKDLVSDNQTLKKEVVFYTKFKSPSSKKLITKKCLEMMKNVRAINFLRK